MKTRLLYIEALADYAKIQPASLIKKEARQFIDHFLELQEIIFASDNEVTIGTKQHITSEDLMYRMRVVHICYHIRYAHIYFNKSNHPENNLIEILKNDFLLKKDEFEPILRMHIKKYLRSKNIEILKKLKFFYGKNL